MPSVAEPQLGGDSLAFSSYSNQVESSTVMGNKSSTVMGNKSSASVAKSEELADTLASWTKHIHDYVGKADGVYDPDDLVRRIRFVSRPLAQALVNSHPLVVEDAFAFVTTLATELGDHLRPFLVKIIAILINDTKCSRSQCIQSLARLAYFDITCISECFTTHIALDGRLRQMYYHVLRTVVEGPVLVQLELPAYAVLLDLLLDCLENFREPLRQKMAVVMQFALQSEKFPTIWASHWDTKTKLRYKKSLPECRQIAKLWAVETYTTSPPRPPRSARRQTVPGSTVPTVPPLFSATSVASPAHPKRPFSHIGRKLNESVLSSIPGDISSHTIDPFPPSFQPPPASIPTPVANSASVATTASVAAAASVATPAAAPPRQVSEHVLPSKPAPPSPHPAPVNSSVFTHPSWHVWALHWIRQQWQSRSFVWGLMFVSILFAVTGVAHSFLAFSQDFEAWKHRVALDDYQTSIDRSEREVLRVSWKLKEMARASAKDHKAATTDWTHDHAQAKAISKAWQTIQDQLAAPP
ncbi:hypothetical protein AC1031_005365 [Aphanomyces cochlioides]|nr:hypothetical protein AC1031_005365 [Aphanomyces cochlioides]